MSTDSRRDRVSVLFLPEVDAESVNAQSLNVREIALRLDPEHFQTTLLYENRPDQRLVDRPGIDLKQLVPRRKTFQILREMLSGHAIIAYVDYSPASYLFLRLPRFLRRGTKAVLHVEAPAAQLGNPSRMLKQLYEGVVTRCDVYSGISDFIVRDMDQSMGKTASYVLPVGVDTRVFMPPAERAHRVPVVLFAGTLVERKGPQLLVEMAADFPNAMFRLVGAGREGFDDTLRSKISVSNLKNVTLEGPKAQAQLVEIMRSSDVFVLPSRLEGIPKVTLEAAATGLPCIVFRDYETPSVLHGLTGFQVDSVNEMKQALARLIEDGELRKRMGAAARKHSEQFDWDLVSRRWQSAYLEIASARQK